MAENCDAIAIFPVYDQFGAIWIHFQSQFIIHSGDTADSSVSLLKRPCTFSAMPIK